MMIKLNDLKERNYQDIIKEYLINENGYINGLNKNYNKTHALDTKMLFEFLYDTQSLQINKLKETYKEKLEEKIIERLNKEISDYGILDVLKKGIKDRGQTLSLMYRKPATTYNKEALELYNKNIFDVVIVMTDRKVVDKQLRDAVLGLDHKDGTISIMDKDSDQLADALTDGTKILVTTIQKFRYILDKIELIKDKNFAIIIDEAHSSTSGKNMEAVTKALTSDEAIEAENEDKLDDIIVDEIKRNGKQANISMFAFTATPKPSTLDMFGHPIPGTTRKEAFHLYSMRQAIEEGFILDVLRIM